MTGDRKRLILKISILVICGFILYNVITFIGDIVTHKFPGWRAFSHNVLSVIYTVMPLIKLVPIIGFGVLLWNVLDKTRTRYLWASVVLLVFLVTQPFVDVNVDTKREYATIQAHPSLSSRGRGNSTESPPLSFKILQAQMDQGNGLQKREVKGQEKVVYTARNPLLTGECIKNARVEPSRSNTPGYEVRVIFNEQGKKTLKEYTSQHKGEPLAIVVDGEVLSAPIIRSEIGQGQCLIQGPFAKAKAQRIAQGISPRK